LVESLLSVGNRFVIGSTICSSGTLEESLRLGNLAKYHEDHDLQLLLGQVLVLVQLGALQQPLQREPLRLETLQVIIQVKQRRGLIHGLLFSPFSPRALLSLLPFQLF
jgi:hypothetical protein